LERFSAGPGTSRARGRYMTNGLNCSQWHISLDAAGDPPDGRRVTAARRPWRAVTWRYVEPRPEHFPSLVVRRARASHRDGRVPLVALEGTVVPWQRAPQPGHHTGSCVGRIWVSHSCRCGWCRGGGRHRPLSQPSHPATEPPRVRWRLDFV